MAGGSLAGVLDRARGLALGGDHLGTGMRMIRATAVIASVTLVVRFGGMVKELMVAGYFGRSDELETFLMALLLPNFIASIMAGGFSPAMIPVLVDLRLHYGKADTQRLMSNAACLAAGLLLAITLLLALSAPYILAVLCSGFSQEKLQMTERIFYCLLPVLLIRGASTMWMDMLNSGHKFALASWAPLATSVSTALALLLLGSTYGANALVVGFLAGALLEASLLAIALRRDGWSLLPRWHGMDQHLAAVIKQYWPGVASAILMGSGDIIDSGMAAMLPAGSVAALGYGNKITSFVLGIGAASLMTAALPHLSAMAAKQRIAEMRIMLWRYVRLLLLVSVPLTLALIACSKEIVALLFQRGAFSADDTAIVASVQAALLLQVPFFFISGFAVRFVMALRANHIMLWGTAICVVTNALGNYIFMTWFGVVGIAVSTAIVYAISAAYLLYMTSKLLDLREKEFSR
ncbi:MAG: murein biosynthesis integral membrane protein MurJ [Hyphomicrobiaceae bacterium]